MKRFNLFALFLCLFISLSAQDSDQIKSEIAAASALKDAQYCVFAKYIDGPEILEINPDSRLSPASILKLYTTAASLDIFGPDHRFITEVYYSGKIKSTRLNGDLYIKAGGDPTLGSLRMPDTPRLEDLISNWVFQLKGLGIKTITGNVYADNSIFSGVLLPWRTSYQNIGNYFAAPVDGLSIRDNTYEIYFKPSMEDGSIAEVLFTEPSIKGLSIKSNVRVLAETTGDNAYVNFVPGSAKAEIFGSIPTSENPLRILAAMPSPADFAADYFKSKLEEAGIKVKGEAVIGAPDTYADKTRIIVHGSPTVHEIIKYTNKRSFNLYAGSLLRNMSAFTGGQGNSGDGILRMKDFMSAHGIDTTNFDVFDGSGLSRDNITTCRITVSLLETMIHHPYGEHYLESLPIVGDPDDMGNMSRRLRGSTSAYNSRVKTGTLDRVRAHAGYTKDMEGRDIAFCIITNNFKGRIREVDSIHERIMNSLSDIGINKKPGKRKPN